MTSHKHDLAAKAFSRHFFETNFSGIAGTSETESSVSVRAQCLLAKKAFFERPSP